MELCDGLDDDCDDAIDEDREDPIEIDLPTYDAVDSPSYTSACAWIGEVSGSLPDPHQLSNLSTYMSTLDGMTSGLTDSTYEDVDALDGSNRCGSDYAASTGDYSSTTTSWPTLGTSGSSGAARFRGYLNIGCDDPLNVTMDLIGNDSVALYIEDQYIVGVNWTEEHLIQATDGGETDCVQCSSDADRAASESCNTAGICE